MVFEKGNKYGEMSKGKKRTQPVWNKGKFL